MEALNHLFYQTLGTIPYVRNKNNRRKSVASFSVSIHISKLRLNVPIFRRQNAIKLPHAVFTCEKA